MRACVRVLRVPSRNKKASFVSVSLSSRPLRRFFLCVSVCLCFCVSCVFFSVALVLFVALFFFSFFPLFFFGAKKARIVTIFAGEREKVRPQRKREKQKKEMSSCCSHKKQHQSFLSRGLSTHKISVSMFSENRNRLVDRFHDAPQVLCSSFLPPFFRPHFFFFFLCWKNSVIVLAGGVDECRNDTDHELPFRQESFFNWAFGVEEPCFYGVIHIATRQA